MPVFGAPLLSQLDTDVIGLIDELREDLRLRVAEPRRWNGVLRRMLEARATQASNSIEGINATLDDVLAVRDGDEPTDADAETRVALEGYQHAMTYVLQATQEPVHAIDEGLLKALHFMMLKHDMTKDPGRWRSGPIHVQRADTGEIVYTGPDPEIVPALISAMLAEPDDANAPAVVKAAMAHLNLVMIHPFRDGNGRMARCLQTLVLAREQLAAPVFSSIEEYLGTGANTRAYYDVLAQVGQGSWHPEGDASPWVRFCLTAHYRQALTVIRRIAAYEEMWTVANRIVQERRLPERAIGAIGQAAYGLRIKRGTYLKLVEVTTGESVADLTASRDLRALVKAGLLQPFGDTRGRYYLGTKAIKYEWEQIRAKWPKGPTEDDPYAIAAGSVGR